MMKLIKLVDELTEDEVLAVRSSKALDKTYDCVINESCNIVDKNGKFVMMLRRNILPANLCAIAYNELRTIHQIPTNRGTASLGVGMPLSVLKDGTRSRTRRMNNILAQVTGLASSSSAVIGYTDRYIRFPYCRKCAWNLANPQAFKRVIPFVQAVSSVFEYSRPKPWQAQQAYVDSINPDFKIPHTVFTTVTVNKNWQSAMHKDKGDFEGGCGVLAALRAGQFTGGYLVLPRYRLAVDLHTSDVLFYNVHDWHYNSPFYGVKGQYERVSLVFYARKNMHHCGNAQEELVRAQNRKQGDPLYEKD